MRKRKALGERVSLHEFMAQFESEENAMAYIESRHWVDGRKCPGLAVPVTRPCHIGAKPAAGISVFEVNR